MKRLAQTLLVLVCTVLISCDENDGKATDTIELSKKEIVFNSAAGVETITTKSDFWWFVEMDDDGVPVAFFDKEVDPAGKDFEFIGEWYHIRRIDRNIEISVVENTTKKPRCLHIQLQAGNWFGSSIKVDQRGE